MRTYNNQESKASRVIEPNKNVAQRVKTIAVETAVFGGGHIHQDAARAHEKKQILENIRSGVHGNVGGVRINVNRGLFGLGAIPNQQANQLTQSELLLLVSHGSRPIFRWTGFLDRFAGKSPNGLATELFNSNIFPTNINYTGQIYLDGCHTGEPSMFGTLNDGSSFAERFKQSLLNLGLPNTFTVKGNLGAAITESGNFTRGHNPRSLLGTEWIEMDRRTTRFVNQNITHINTNMPLKVAKINNDIANNRLIRGGTNPSLRRGSSVKVVY